MNPLGAINVPVLTPEEKAEQEKKDLIYGLESVRSDLADMVAEMVFDLQTETDLDDLGTVGDLAQKLSTLAYATARLNYRIRKLNGLED